MEILLKTKGKEKDYVAENGKVQEWERSYCGVDVGRQLEYMAQWLKDNPDQRKTHRGMPRFVNNWLKREAQEAVKKSRWPRGFVEPVWETDGEKLRSKKEQLEWRKKDNVNEKIRRLKA